jgi:adenosylhomocysteine nucleosidase
VRRAVFDGVDAAVLTGVVAALRSEASCLDTRQGRAADARLLVQAGGMGCERAARAALGLVRAGAGALLSWGVAGALDPSLRCGQVLLASEVVCQAPLVLKLGGLSPTVLPAGARLRTSDPWRGRLQAALQPLVPLAQGTLLTRAEVACEAALKAQLFRETAALAVDMESAAVGVVANLHGLPFMVLRVIADTAADSLPVALRRLASPAAPGVLGWLAGLPPLCAPGAWPALLRLGRRYRQARQVLRQCAGQPCGAPEGPGAARALP